MSLAAQDHKRASSPGPTRRPYRLWSIDIDPITMQGAVNQIATWVRSGERNCKIVVTPNVDHVVQLYRRPELLPVYRTADLSLADGWPLVTMSRLYSRGLPERVPGSDLLPSTCVEFQTQGEPLRIFLLGGMDGVPDRAARAIQRRWCNVQVVGALSPCLGFERDDSINREICRRVNDSDADLLVVGLGFPKQERWLDENRDSLRVPVALALGATIDFLAGEQKRAPNWVQSIRMEWFYRMSRDPRRLAKRYAIDGIVFPWVCLKEKTKQLVQRYRLQRAGSFRDDDTSPPN